VARQFPKTDFVATGSADILTQDTANVETWSYASDQDGYLEGWVAGETGLSPVGIVDGELAPFNELAYKAFALGLKAANPKAVELKPIYTGSWTDANLAGQAAKAQVAAGAKLIVTAAEEYTPGVLSVAKTDGIATIGASNTSSADAPKVNIGLVGLDFTPALRQVVAHWQAGTYAKRSYLSTIANGGLVWSDLNFVSAAPRLPSDIQAKITQLAANIASGKVHLPAVS
jgi:basic membrane protein A